MFCASSESDPNCTTNATSQYIALEGNYIKYSCEVTYAGNWAPVMTWRIRGNRATHVMDESYGNTVKFSIVIHITLSVEAFEISCETSFDQPKRGTSSNNGATNVPYYYHSYSTQTPTVSCKYLAIFSFLDVWDWIIYNGLSVETLETENAMCHWLFTAIIRQQNGSVWHLHLFYCH